MKATIKLVKEPKNYSPEIDSGIQNGLIEVQPLLQQTIQTNHKYINRTGRLQNASKVDISKFNVKAYIDDRIAKYGKYIHDGTKHISPDPFIANAIENNKEKIKQTITNTINRSMGV